VQEFIARTSLGMVGESSLENLKPYLCTLSCQGLFIESQLSQHLVIVMSSVKK
jgi:hypothetical protein